MADNFSVEIEGYNRVQNGLRKFASSMPDVTQDVIYQWGQEVRAILKSTPYPPKRSNQRYVRTGRLANSFSAVRSYGGSIISNSAPYSRFVIGDTRGEGQAWMHAGRWWKARDVIDENAPALVEKLTQRVNKELEAIE